jgi:hypothetical protein
MPRGHFPVRKAYCILAPLAVAIYLCALQWDWLTRAELSVPGRRPVFSDQLDLRKPGEFVWDVPAEAQEFIAGEARLSLALNLGTLYEVPKGREGVFLRARVKAEGTAPGGAREDRLVRDWYFKTDEPFSSEGRSLWESFGLGRLEYGLAGVRVVPGESLRITLSILTPDGRLAAGSPRLKLVVRHDGAGKAKLSAILDLLRQSGHDFCIVCVALTLGLAVLAWPRGAAQALAVTNERPPGPDTRNKPTEDGVRGSLPA